MVVLVISQAMKSITYKRHIYKFSVFRQSLRIYEKRQNYRYAKKTQISLDLKKYRYVGDSAPRGCTEDEGRSLGVGLQEQAPKHLKLLWSKAMVVSVEEKVPPDGISCESKRRA